MEQIPPPPKKKLFPYSKPVFPQAKVVFSPNMAARLESRLTLLLLQSEEVFLPGRPALWQQEDTPTRVDRESSLNGLAHNLPGYKTTHYLFVIYMYMIFLRQKKAFIFDRIKHNKYFEEISHSSRLDEQMKL